MQSWLEGRIWVGKVHKQQDDCKLENTVKQADSNTWESFTRSGLKLESVHQESPRSDIFRKRATKPLWTRDNVRSVLHGLWRKELSGPKSLFSDESKFCISFGNKVPESGGRVERHRFHVLEVAVWVSTVSDDWAAMSSAGVGPLCFLKSTVNAAIYQEILEYFMLPSADKLYGDADFIFQQDLAPAHTAKGTKSWFNDHGVTVLDWARQTRLTWTPLKNLWGIVKRKMRDTRPNNADELKATVKETWASIPPQ